MFRHSLPHVDFHVSLSFAAFPLPIDVFPTSSSPVHCLDVASSNLNQYTNFTVILGHFFTSTGDLDLSMSSLC